MNHAFMLGLGMVQLSAACATSLQVPWKTTAVHGITTQMVHDPSLPTMR
jgi:hypothetical protein